MASNQPNLALIYNNMNATKPFNATMFEAYLSAQDSITNGDPKKPGKDGRLGVSECQGNLVIDLDKYVTRGGRGERIDDVASIRSRVFEQIDADKDGWLNWNEFQNIVRVTNGTVYGFDSINNGNPFNQQQLESYFSRFDSQISNGNLSCSGSSREGDRKCEWQAISGQDQRISESESLAAPFYIYRYTDSDTKCSGSSREGDRTCTTSHDDRISVLSRNFFTQHDKNKDGIISYSEFDVSQHPVKEKKTRDRYDRNADRN